jgi:MFS family permease
MTSMAQALRPAVAVPVDRFRDVPRYLWLVLISAFLGWMFDAADVTILTLVLAPSVSDLLGTSDPRIVAPTGGLIVGIKLAAWGLGGIAFGVMTDRIGRSRTMAITILIYSVFTGLSAFAQSWWQLAILQAVAGIGIGGEWAAGAALIAETWPERLRAKALQIMQLAFAFGFFVAAVVNLALGPLGWRWVFLAGAAPAVLIILIRWFVREPERWLNVRSSVPHSEVSIQRIFRPDLRRAAVVGSVVAIAMFVAIYGATAWIPLWIPQLLSADQLVNASAYVSYAFILANVGAALGNLTLIWLPDAIGRRPAYFVFSAGALIVSEVVFRQVRDYTTLLLLMPVLGYFVIGGAGSLAVYLPELFPTLVRGTGQGFCWNIARLITGVAPIATGLLVAASGSYPDAAATVALMYVVGLVVIWFGPETRGRPLRDA